jgi:glycopeptide antibiotics resistance protein
MVMYGGYKGELMMLIDFHLGVLMISVLVWFTISVYLVKKRNKTFTYITFFSVFYVYLMFVINYTQFPIIIHDYANASSIREAISTNVYLIPFQDGFNLSYLLSRAVLLNVLLTIPFGFGISYIMKTNWKRIILLGLLVGVVIESLQFAVLIINMFHLRSVTIDDVIFNFIGVIVGYGLFLIFSYVYIKVVHKLNIELNSISKYVYEVSKDSFTTKA